MLFCRPRARLRIDAAAGQRASRRIHEVANTKSAIKRMRQNERRRLRNRTLRSKLRSTVKSARATSAGADARSAVLEAIRALDKAVTKGVIHRNTAARKKSALARSLAAPR
jgi:small subunit ribosomal protein S20